MPRARFDRLPIYEGYEGFAFRLQGIDLRVPPHRHRELELNLVLAGRAAYLVGERRVELLPFTALWLFPNQEHVLLDRSEDVRMWVGVFTPRLLRQVCTTERTRPLLRKTADAPLVRWVGPRAAQELDALFAQVLRHADRAVWNAALGHLAVAAWASYLEADETRSQPTVGALVRRAIALITEDLELSRDELAARLRVNPSHLSKIFAREAGVTLTAFRNRRRLERFLQIYGDGSEWSMMSAALEAGFGSYAQFHRVFRALVGVSPADYRSKPNSSKSSPS